MSKLDKLKINSESTRLSQRPKIDFIEYKNQKFLDNSHINLRSRDAASSYHCLFPITGSKIPKWDCILNCFYDCPSINAPDFESSEQHDRLFTTSLYKIKLHIFKNTSKCPMHGLRPLKYKNMCELCDTIQDKEKRRKIIAKKYSVINEEVIDVFHNFFTFPQ